MAGEDYVNLRLYRTCEKAYIIREAKLLAIREIMDTPMSYEEAKAIMQRLTGHPNHEIIGIGWSDSDE